MGQPIYNLMRFSIHFIKKEFIMKKPIHIFSFVALILFTLTTHAYGPGVKLISSKIDMSPGMEGGFKENNTPPELIANGSAKAYAKANPVFGKKTENIMIPGSHAYIIENKTGRAQNYVLEYKLSLNDGRFIRKTDIVLLNDNAVARGSATSYTNQYFPTTGNFRFTVETSIQGEHRDHKSDVNFVLVS
jgi:hypothetical protein